MRSISTAARGRPMARGFTLIELMITVAIVVVIAAVAMPSYREYVRRGVRTEAQAFMQAAATRQNQFLVDRRAFAPDLVTLDVPVTASLNSAYTFTLALVDGPPRGFLLTATPTGAQASESCGTLTINQAGAKTASKAGCW